jgi:hypothetical protein
MNKHPLPCTSCEFLLCQPPKQSLTSCPARRCNKPLTPTHPIESRCRHRSEPAAALERRLGLVAGTAAPEALPRHEEQPAMLNHRLPAGQPHLAQQAAPPERPAGIGAASAAPHGAAQLPPAVAGVGRAGCPARAGSWAPTLPAAPPWPLPGSWFAGSSAVAAAQPGGWPQAAACPAGRHAAAPAAAGEVAPAGWRPADGWGRAGRLLPAAAAAPPQWAGW